MSSFESEAEASDRGEGKFDKTSAIEVDVEVAGGDDGGVEAEVDESTRMRLESPRNTLPMFAIESCCEPLEYPLFDRERQSAFSTL